MLPSKIMYTIGKIAAWAVMFGLGFAAGQVIRGVVLAMIHIFG